MVKLKLAFYFYKLENAGGAERMICALANALANRGFDVHLISWDDADACAFYPINSQITWHKLGFSAGLADKLRRVYVLKNILRKNTIQILIGFVMSGDKVIYAASKLSGVKLVVAERNAPSMYWICYNYWSRKLSFLMMRWADVITVQFPDFIFSYPAILHKKMSAIPNPVKKSLLLASPDIKNEDDRYVLLAVGRLDKVQKKVDVLVRAFSIVADENRDWYLYIVGDGPAKDELSDMVKELGLSQRVCFQSSTTDIFSVYQKSHVFVMPSLWEGFPNALAEAMSHGLPAIGFRNAEGVSNLITDGDSGWLVNGHHNHLSLAKTLSDVINNKEERVRRGLLASQSMLEYEPEAQFSRWESLLISLNEGRSVE